MPLKKDTELLEQWEKHKNISESGLDEQHTSARDDHTFYAGDSMAYSATVTDKGRRSSIVFNKVKPYVDAVAGFMVQLRRKPQYQARMFDSEQQRELSTYYNAVSDYVRDNANMSHLESRQDREMLITGIGAIDTNIIYEHNPDGEVRAENIQFDDIFWDPQSREPNIVDSRWVFRRKKFNRKEAVKRFKGTKPEDFESYKNEQTNFTYNPQGGLYDKIALGIGVTEEDLVQVYYYQYWELETYYRARNPLFEIEDPIVGAQVAQLMEVMRQRRERAASKETVEDYFEFDPFAEYLVMTPSIKTDMKEVFDFFNLDVEYQRHEKRVYYTVIVTGEEILDKFKSPDQQGFTIKFKTGDYDEENNRWFGMVHQLKHPARYANKALTEMLYVIASNSKGGVMYEESAVEDPARFEQQWATTRSAIKVNDGALSGGKIAPKAQAALPSGFENVYTISNDSMGEVTGINKEFLGNATSSQVSALLESQRINQVVSTLACYFDSIAFYQKEHARLMMTYFKMLAENSEGRMIRIIGEDGTQRFDVLTQDKFNVEYDVDIGEAPISATQKQETAQLMMQMADKVSVFGQNIYAMVVDYLPIKEADKAKMIEALQPPPPSPEQQQAQQALQQIQMEGQMSQIAKNRGDALLREAQAAKTQAEIPQTEAETDRARADTLRALAEGEQKNLENDVIRQQPINNLDLVI